MLAYHADGILMDLFCGFRSHDLLQPFPSSQERLRRFFGKFGPVPAVASSRWGWDQCHPPWTYAYPRERKACQECCVWLSWFYTFLQSFSTFPLPILVGGDWNMTSMFPFSWEFHHPNWQTHTLQRGRRKTSNQKSELRWVRLSKSLELGLGDSVWNCSLIYCWRRLLPSGKRLHHYGKSSFLI